MALHSYTSQPSMTDFEGLDVKEYDLDTITELLYEPEFDETNNRTELVQSTEQLRTNAGVPVCEEPIERMNPGIPEGNYWSLENLEVEIQNTNWLDMMDETFEPCSRAWYGDMYIEEIDGMFDVGYYPVPHTATVSDDIGYVCLWGEN